jgi:glyoxylase-like metal-dependent hydrolase (beta-lactamase superfamily II)
MKIKTRVLIIVALAAFLVLGISAQDAKPKKDVGAKKDENAVAATSAGSNVGATLVHAEDALNMRRGPLLLDAYSTLEYWASGTTNALGQAYSPDGSWPTFKTTVHVSLNYVLPAIRMDITRTNPDGPIRGGGGLPLAAPQHQITVANGKYAWNESAPGAGFLPNTTANPVLDAANDRLMPVLTTPVGFLKSAKNNGADTKVTTEGGTTVITTPIMGMPVSATLDAKNLITKIEWKSDNPVLGDMMNEIDYSGYKDLGETPSDAIFPERIVEKQGGFPVLDLTVSKTEANNPYVFFPVPDNVEKAFTEGGGPAPVKVDTTKVVDGVYFMTGGTHNSVAVEFKDYVALVECPLNDDRSMAVINAVKKATSNKPIKYVIATHQHFDHTGGLRACVANGSTIVTYTPNKPYFEKVFANPHSVKPDELTKSKKKPVIEAVAEKRVFTDATQTMELYHLTGSDHTDSMLVVYLPKSKTLIEADVWNPVAANAPMPKPNKENMNLVNFINAQKLDVQTILPLHGRQVTMADLNKLVSSGSGD